MNEPNQPTDRTDPMSIEKIARETCDAIVRHLQSGHASDEERREAEREARIKAEVEKLKTEGKVPPRTTRDDV